jgi:predicted RNase H-like nuclease (RuvC/YqgF family)
MFSRVFGRVKSAYSKAAENYDEEFDASTTSRKRRRLDDDQVERVVADNGESVSELKLKIAELQASLAEKDAEIVRLKDQLDSIMEKKKEEEPDSEEQLIDVVSDELEDTSDAIPETPEAVNEITKDHCERDQDTKLSTPDESRLQENSSDSKLDVLSPIDPERFMQYTNVLLQKPSKDPVH